jgi:hypothetical protein
MVSRAKVTTMNSSGYPQLPLKIWLKRERLRGG